MRLIRSGAAALLLCSFAACGGQPTAPLPTNDTGSTPAAPQAGPVPLKPDAATPSAGIDCSRAASAAERAICADPVLVELDAAMAAAWQAALSRSDDHDALRADQRAWLAQRDACAQQDNARACLRARYAIRNAVLGGVAGGPFSWAGKWQRMRGEGLFELTPEPGGKAYAVKLDASSGSHTGVLDQARATPDGDHLLRVANTGDGAACRLELRRVANQIELVEIDSAYECGAAAMGVTFAGRYARSDVAQVQWTLLTRDLAATADADARIRNLLGNDAYAQLVDTCQLVSQDDATPGLVTCGVRGLFTLMEAALQQHGDAVRAGLIVDDEVHWWSSDPATAATPPPWFDAWRKRFADKPVRLMSQPGTPLLTDAAHGR